MKACPGFRSEMSQSPDETTNEKEDHEMDTYEIMYDYTDDGGNENTNCYETFEGSWTELQEYIKQMRENGCYNITAAVIREEYEDDE